MLEWLEVRLDVAYDKRLAYEYHIEQLKCSNVTESFKRGNFFGTQCTLTVLCYFYLFSSYSFTCCLSVTIICNVDYYVMV